MDICSSTAAVSHLAHLVGSLLRMRDVRFDNRLRQIEVFKTNPWQQVLMSKFLRDYKVKKLGYFVPEYCIMFNVRWQWVPSIVQNAQSFTGNGEECVFKNSRGSKTSENQNTSTTIIYLFTLIVIVHCF